MLILITIQMIMSKYTLIHPKIKLKYIRLWVPILRMGN
jgi:hypothetical protein